MVRCVYRYPPSYKHASTKRSFAPGEVHVGRLDTKENAQIHSETAELSMLKDVLAEAGSTQKLSACHGAKPGAENHQAPGSLLFLLVSSLFVCFLLSILF